MPYCLSYTIGKQIFLKKFLLYSKQEAALFIINNFNADSIYYSHKLSFDFFLILEGFITINANIKIICLDNNLYGASVTKGKKTIKFRCSLKLIRIGLANFYPDLYFKKKIEIDFHDTKNTDITYDKLNPSLDKIFTERNETDVEILMHGYSNFVSVVCELGITKREILKHYTPGGIILAFFVKNYNSINLNLLEYQKRTLTPYFFGGRCEVFGNKKTSEVVFHFDYYGMYHLSMYECIPDGLFNLENTTDNNVDLPGFYYIEAELYNDIPILPIKLGKLMFVNGYISG